MESSCKAKIHTEFKYYSWFFLLIIFFFFAVQVNGHPENDDDSLDDEYVPDPVYVKYSFRQFAASANLPIYHTHQDILKALRDNQVVVIEGSTGCGKSTQVSVWVR